MIQKIDYNCDGECDFDEFVCLMVMTLAKADHEEEELVTVFKRFDKNGDGEICASDLIQIMKELGQEIDIDEAHDIIFAIDRDSDGSVNFLEFVQMMMFDTKD